MNNFYKAYEAFIKQEQQKQEVPKSKYNYTKIEELPKYLQDIFNSNIDNINFSEDNIGTMTENVLHAFNKLMNEMPDRIKRSYKEAGMNTIELIESDAFKRLLRLEMLDEFMYNVFENSINNILEFAYRDNCPMLTTEYIINRINNIFNEVHNSLSEAYDEFMEEVYEDKDKESSSNKNIKVTPIMIESFKDLMDLLGRAGEDFEK